MIAISNYRYPAVMVTHDWKIIESEFTAIEDYDFDKIEISGDLERCILVVKDRSLTNIGLESLLNYIIGAGLVDARCCHTVATVNGKEDCVEVIWDFKDLMAALKV